MYLGGHFEGESVVKLGTQPRPFGPGFSKEDCQKAVAIEVWHSNFEDPGDDFDEWKLLDKNGAVLKKQRFSGY